MVPRADTATLAFERVAFAYSPGAPRAIDGLSLVITPGELVGVIGPNGSGKSTLARLAAGLVVPNEGTVRVAGHDTRSAPRAELSRALALVPQRDEVAFAYTAWEVVLMGRAPHLGFFGLETKEDARIAADALRACEAWELRGRSFATLSGGEQKRVAIARALAQQTQVLVLDEPTAFLDIHHQVAVLDLVATRVRETRLSALLVVHDLNLAAQYCDRLLLMRAGTVVALGTVAEVMTYRRIRETFGVDVYVGVNELTGARYFVPMRGRAGEVPSAVASDEAPLAGSAETPAPS
jgi:iron complex transport system ATP-binding protein